MRVFGRILYAITMVGLFLLTFTYSRDLMQNRYLEDVFGASLTDETSDLPKFYYFYTSIPDYHNSDPIFAIELNGYEIYGYEVLTADINNDNQLEVAESVYIIVYSPTEELAQVGGLFLVDTVNDSELEINLQRFKLLNLINGVNDQGTVYLPKDDFLSENFDQIKLTDQSGNVLLQTDFSIQDSDFIIKTFMENFYAQYNRLPGVDDLTNLADNTIFPKQTHVADDYAYIFYVGMGIYFVVLAISTFLIFFRKKKHAY